MGFKIFSADDFPKRLDARLALPRPVNEQNLSSRRAFQRLSRDVGKGVIALLSAFISSYLLVLTAGNMEVALWSYGGGATICAIIFVFALFGNEVFNIKAPYMLRNQTETFGAARRANLADLKKADLVTPNTESPLPKAVPIGTFGFFHWFTFPIRYMARHVVVFGPPGSGKSASMFINVARAWSQIGGAVLLDIKGEIYRHSAHYYVDEKLRYRIDFKNPECSDYIELIPLCKGDMKMADEVASFMIGFDANSQKSENPFWPQSAKALLKLMILHLAETEEHPTPDNIFEFLASHPYDPKTKIDMMGEAFLSSPQAAVREGWAPFSRAVDPKLQGSIIISMTTPLEQFREPAVRKIFTPPTPEEKRRGRKTVDFRDLRKKGCALFVVVPEGQASRLEAVVATIFGVALNVLRTTGDDPEACHTLIQLDEAGNVPLRNLSEDIGVGRGRKICFMLGYQNINQPEKQYGKAYAYSVLESIGARIFLPGLSGETAQYAERLVGKTTVFQRSDTDAVGRALDSERLSEVSTDLLNVTALREMMPFVQAVTVIETIPAVFFGFPPNAKEVDKIETIPPRFDIDYYNTPAARKMFAEALLTPVQKMIETDGDESVSIPVASFSQHSFGTTESASELDFDDDNIGGDDDGAQGEHAAPVTLTESSDGVSAPIQLFGSNTALPQTFADADNPIPPMHQHEPNVFISKASDEASDEHVPRGHADNHTAPFTPYTPATVQSSEPEAATPTPQSTQAAFVGAFPAAPQDLKKAGAGDAVVDELPATAALHESSITPGSFEDIVNSQTAALMNAKVTASEASEASPHDSEEVLVIDGMMAGFREDENINTHPSAQDQTIMPPPDASEIK